MAESVHIISSKTKKKKVTSKQVASSHTKSKYKQVCRNASSRTIVILEKLSIWNKTNELNMMMIMTHDDTVVMKLVLFFKLLFPMKKERNGKITKWRCRWLARRNVFFFFFFDPFRSHAAEKKCAKRHKRNKTSKRSVSMALQIASYKSKNSTLC